MGAIRLLGTGQKVGNLLNADSLFFDELVFYK